MDQYSAEEVQRMVKQRQDEGLAYKNTALSRIKLSNSLEAAIAEGREDEADFCREQLAKVCFVYVCTYKHERRISRGSFLGAKRVINPARGVSTPLIGCMYV